jgi:outer membrane protein TolC
VLSGCGTVKPQAHSANLIRERAVRDRVEMYQGQEPVTAPITFAQAAARALKYNLDYRLKLMETALSSSLSEVARFDMLPRLVAGAGYESRNNDSGGRSIGIDDGVETLRPSTSQERDRGVANLSFSWNLLDFGVSYYRAQQKADGVLMAQERQRKVIQNVLQDVRNSYWRARGAQRLLDQVDDLLKRSLKGLNRAREAERRGLLPQAQVLAYQRALLDAVNLLTIRRQDLELSRAELMALMSLPPGTVFSLAESPEPQLPAAPTDIEALETMALERRPEVMEEWYRRRVTENDIKAAKVLLWPNLSLDTGLQYDSNRFLYNHQWVDTGFKVSWNLFKLFQMPALERAQRDQISTDELRRTALSMAVLTQVRVGAQRYALAQSELEFANESLHVDQRLLEYARAAARSQFDSELEVIRAEARALLSNYQRTASYANAQAAWGRLYNSVGLDVLPETIAGHDVDSLARAIEQSMAQWQISVFGAAAPVGVGP